MKLIVEVPAFKPRKNITNYLVNFSCGKQKP